MTVWFVAATQSSRTCSRDLGPCPGGGPESGVLCNWVLAVRAAFADVCSEGVMGIQKLVRHPPTDAVQITDAGGFRVARISTDMAA
jgi:hypothetical protein